jgi:hypothetical protein
MTKRCSGKRLLRIVAISAALAFVAGCGSSSKTVTPQAPTRTQAPPPASGFVDSGFRAKVAATCKAAGSTLKAQGPFPFPTFDPEHPLVTDLGAIGAYESKTVTALQAWQQALHALGTPTAGSGAWSTFLTAVDRNLASTIDQQRAAKQGDSTAFTKTYHDLTSHAQTDTQSAAAIGLPSCVPGNPT